MKKLKAIGWIILFAILWGILILLGVYAVVSAEPITELSCPADTVSFTDDVDLICKVDAVIAVRDIVECGRWQIVRVDAYFPDSVEIYESGISYDSLRCANPGYERCEIKKLDYQIRTRKLVGVTVTEETVYKASFNNKAQWVRHPDFVIYPGTAIVWFEWEVE